MIVFVFFFNDTATTEIYTLSLHDALPISPKKMESTARPEKPNAATRAESSASTRSEEHTSELQSRLHLVCRLLLEKKKNKPASHSLCPYSLSVLLYFLTALYIMYLYTSLT